MKHTELLDIIRGLPLVEQVTLAEAILHGLGSRLSQTIPVGVEDQEALRRQMQEVAAEAAAYYRNDPEVALWRGFAGDDS